jgi:transcriptional regulator GlxA family with amidase domain
MGRLALIKVNQARQKYALSSGPQADLNPKRQAMGKCVAGLSETLRKSLQHLHDNFAARVRLNDLAALTGRTPFQIIRAFRKELGITPHALLIRIRVERGTALLAQGEPIAGVAAEVGFVDQAHFTRHFKRMHATTPRRFLDSRAAQAA